MLVGMFTPAMRATCKVQQQPRGAARCDTWRLCAGAVSEPEAGGGASEGGVLVHEQRGQRAGQRTAEDDPQQHVGGVDDVKGEVASGQQVQHLFIWDLFHGPRAGIQRFNDVEKPTDEPKPLFRAAGHFVGHGEALAGR